MWEQSDFENAESLDEVLNGAPGTWFTLRR